MRPTHRLALTAMFVGAAAFAQTSPGTAADPTPATRSPAPAPSSAETGKSAAAMSASAVLSMLHQVNQDEIKLGRIAQPKAQNDKVKDYAKDMIDDHTALDKKIGDFVQKGEAAGLELPGGNRNGLCDHSHVIIVVLSC